MSESNLIDALAVAMQALRRLADPAEIAGFGDATAEHNDTPEMRVRLRKAQRAVTEVLATLQRGT